MPRPKPEGWKLRYVDPRSPKRLLISLPEGMFSDAHAVAKELGISTAELFRVAVTREMVRLAAENSFLLQGTGK
jgi:hypothetical protein